MGGGGIDSSFVGRWGIFRGWEVFGCCACWILKVVVMRSCALSSATWSLAVRSTMVVPLTRRRRPDSTCDQESDQRTSYACVSDG